ncbi:MAG: type II secretion system GspH family protein [Anaerohalosphaeraceae bacterium]|nr:type II secretion system GspH family protein [Anaerohalosphaeraceae bacterium]
MRNLHSQFGFTIVEILVTVVVIAILAAGIFSLSQSVDKRAKLDMAKAQLVIIDTALEQYYDFHGKFYDLAGGYSPNCDSDIEEIYYRLSLVPQAKKAIDELDSTLVINVDGDGILEIIDPWGQELYYSYSKANEDNFPLVWSSGPDANSSTAEQKQDDITNR